MGWGEGWGEHLDRRVLGAQRAHALGQLGRVRARARARAGVGVGVGGEG